ncbi:MAG: hypothetical protein JWR23_1636 [Mucilaginibacter sp.]|nr:hypothetical protein [Mucilaginibacter sp.]
MILAAAIIVGCSMYKTADAQLRISLGFNIGSQPDWGPVGYDHASYYYVPDIDSYYDVPNHQYVYYQNNVWIRSGALPPRYANYDLYHGYKVVVNERNPWERNTVYRTRYAGYRGRHDQPIIRESRDEKYRNHWNGDRGNNGRGPGDRGNNGYGQDNRGQGNRGQDNRGQGNRGQDNRGQDNRGQDNRGHGNGHDKQDHGDH